MERSDWSISNHVIVVLKAQVRDVAFINYVTQLPNIFRTLGKVVILNVIYEAAHVRDRTALHQEETILADLSSWAYEYNILIRGYKLSKHSRDIYRESLDALSHSYDDAVVLFTHLDLKMTAAFLRRCFVTAQKQKQFYVPQLFKRNQSAATVSAAPRPVCVHISDYLRVSGNRHGRRRKKPIDEYSAPIVNTAFDPALSAFT